VSVADEYLYNNAAYAQRYSDPMSGRPSRHVAVVACMDARLAVSELLGLANGEAVPYKGAELRLPWATESRLPVWVAAYGPKALALAGEMGDGFILQLGDPDIAAWSIAAVRKAAADAGRAAGDVKICVAAPAYVTDGSQQQLAHARDQCRWFGGMVGNHVADLVSRYGTSGPVPRALTDYIAGREGYDYAHHGRAGNPSTDFVPDEIVDRFCLLGPASAHIARLRAKLVRAGAPAPAATRGVGYRIPTSVTEPVTVA